MVPSSIHYNDKLSSNLTYSDQPTHCRINKPINPVIHRAIFVFTDATHSIDIINRQSGIEHLPNANLIQILFNERRLGVINHRQGVSKPIVAMLLKDRSKDSDAALPFISEKSSRLLSSEFGLMNLELRWKVIGVSGCVMSLRVSSMCPFVLAGGW